MGTKKCKKVKKGDLDPKKQNNNKFKCKKCNLSANKEQKLCKPIKKR